MTPLEVTIAYAALTLSLLALAYIEYRREKCPTPREEAASQALGTENDT